MKLELEFIPKTMKMGILIEGLEITQLESSIDELMAVKQFVNTDDNRYTAVREFLETIRGEMKNIQET